MAKKTRMTLGSFDLMKGFLMILIVFVHIYCRNYLPLATPSTSNWFLRILGPFYVPILPTFFLVIGYTFKPRSFSRVVISSAKQYLVPFVIVSLVVTILFPVVHYLNYHDLKSAIEETIKYTLAFLLGIPCNYNRTIFGVRIFEASTIYFFVAVFWVTLFLNAILRIKKTLARWISMIAGLVVSYFLFHLKFNFYCLPLIFPSLLYCYIGYLFRQHDLFSALAKKKFLYLVLFAGFLYPAFSNRIFMLYAAEDSLLTILDYSASILSGIFLFCVAVLWSRKEWAVLEPIRFLGRNTYWIMAIHACEYMIFPWYRMSEFLPGNTALRLLVECLIRYSLITLGVFALRAVSGLLVRRKLKKLAL